MKKILNLLVIILIVLWSAGAYYLITEEIYLIVETKNEIIDGITLTLPLETQLTKTSNNTYEDKALGLHLRIFKNAITDFDNDIVQANYEISMQNNTNMVHLENLTLTARAYQNPEMTYIIVSNRGIDEGILISTSNESLAVDIANSVNFESL